MALLDWIAPESGLRVEGEGVFLRPARNADFEEWRELRARVHKVLDVHEVPTAATRAARAMFTAS